MRRPQDTKFIDRCRKWNGTDDLGTGFVRRIDDILTDNGIDLTGWRLDLINAISYDGSFVAGYGTNPQGKREAWIKRKDRYWYFDKPNGPKVNMKRWGYGIPLLFRIFRRGNHMVHQNDRSHIVIRPVDLRLL